MSKKGKKLLEARGKIDRLKKYDFDDGFDLLFEIQFGTFDESVDVAINLGVDPRHADQMVRGACVLPHGTGRTVRVLVFAKGEKVKEAEGAGADFVGGEELIEKIKGGWLDFDKTIATPDMMGMVGKIARILGPRGLMPNPKVGTVTFEVSRAVSELKAGRVEYRVDRDGIIRAPIGRVSFGKEKVAENLFSLLDVLIKAKPSTSKGTYLKSVTISTTQGPGIRLDPIQLQQRLIK